jgi:pimeloyl-ACP methyl ester carboxylesterase
MAERIGKLAYDRAGSGPPLLLIHGLGGTRGIWSPQFEALAAERDVIAVDMPGFGASESLPAERPASAVALGEEIAGLCGELGIERPHIAGNSLGAWVALEMARAGRAASLCLISPAGMWRRPLGGRRVDSRRLAHRLRPVVFAALYNRGARERMLRTTVGRPDRISPKDARRLIGGWIDAPGYDAANEQMRTHVFERPEEVTVPTTIAWGEYDRLVAPPRPERRPPNSRFLVLEGCGHTPNWDEPELITRLLLESSSGAESAAGAEAAA